MTNIYKHFTCSTVLSACADIGAKEAGEQIHGYLVKTGILVMYIGILCLSSVIDFKF